MHYEPLPIGNNKLRLPLLTVLILVAHPLVAVENQGQVLQGHVPAIVTRLAPRTDLAKSTRLNLAIGLPLRNQSALTNLIAELYNPRSPIFLKYLTPAQFTARFGPTEQDYVALLEFAKTNNFTVTTHHQNRLLLDVNASVADIEKAFHIRMGGYQHPTEGRTFYAPDVEPSLNLSIPINFIGGLNNYDLPRPANVKTSPEAQPNNGSAPDGSYMGLDFRKAYAPGTPLTGAGQAVALVQFDGFYSNDIIAYEALAGLPNVPLQTVLIDGYDGTPSSAAGNVEVSLDIETVVSMAPDLSRILLYEGGPGGIPEDILSQIANDNFAKQISSSWTWDSYDPNSEAIFLQFAAQGQTYFNATGDHDAFVGPISQVPSDNPYITQVGGTTLTMNGAGDGYASESVWNRGGGIGSSGGISTKYAIPTWQQAVDMSANQGSTTMRNVPDVAMAAEGIYVMYGNGSSGAFGGTSCAAPLWAGFAALMNQQAVAASRPVVGFLNPAIYQIGTNSVYASCFHDVTSGDNMSSGSPSKFMAVPGYDLCTGWGTPNGSNLINSIVGSPVLVPFIVSAGMSLVMETCPNNVVDPGETVTMSFALQNIGFVSTSNLVATLQTGPGVVSPSSPRVYGALVGGDTVTRQFTFIADGTCGGTNVAVLLLQDGALNLGTIVFPFTLGYRSTLPILAEDFDQVTPPDLPSGWTASWTGTGAPWCTTNVSGGSAPNCVFARDPASPSDNSLISPSFFVGGNSTQLSFHHNYYTETLYDGAVLEISIAGAPFVDILAAGGSFVTNGYVHVISTCCGNPLGGRPAWTGSSSGFITTVANLPVSASGKTAQLRWRFCSDTLYGAIGWYVDDVSVVDGFSCCTAIRPVIQSIAPSNNEVAITWNSVSNRNYRIQCTTNLADTNWMDLPGDVTAQGFSATKTDEMETAAQKFYRVVLLP